MKNLITLALFLLIPIISFAQVDITRTAGTGYYLETAEGDTLQLRGATPFYNSYHTAYEDAITHSSSTGMTVHVRSNIEDRVSAEMFIDETIIIEEVTDTVYVTETVMDTVFVDRIETVIETETVVDTVFVTEYVDRIETVVDTVTVTEYVDRIETVTDTLYVTEYDTTYIDRVDTVNTIPYTDPMEALYANHSVSISSPADDSTAHMFTTSGWTTADRVDIKYDCSDNVGWRNANEANQFIYSDEFVTTCTRDMTMTLRYTKGTDTTDVVEITPLSVITGELFENTSSFLTHFDNNEHFPWTQTWGNLAYTTGNSLLTITLPERSIARLQWDDIPEHRNIRYTIKETLDESWSTGAHIGGRHSASDTNMNSVETYINSNGLGISVFSNNGWSNPHNFPFAWEYGDVVNYTVEIIDDTIRAKIWHEGEEVPTEWLEYTDPIIGAVPAGRFAIGSTGPGIYLIDSVEIDILD